MKAQWLIPALSALGLAACAPVTTGPLASVCRSSAAADRASVLSEKFENAKAGVMVVAHRACWRETAENSISAINSCIGMGVDMVELDVRQTSDGHLVLMHDETVDRMTSGTGRVSDMTLAELRTLRLKSADGGDRAVLLDESIPTLAEALDAANGRILVNIDAKDEIRLAALDLADQKGMLGQIIVKAPAESARAFLSGNPDYLGRGEFMPIITQDEAPLSQTIDGFAVIGPEAFEVIYSDPSYVTEGADVARGTDSRIWINTIFERLAPGHWDGLAVSDPDAHWGKLIKAGASMFQTDHPRELLEYLRRTNKHC